MTAIQSSAFTNLSSIDLLEVNGGGWGGLTASILGGAGFGSWIGSAGGPGGAIAGAIIGGVVGAIVYGK